MLSRPPSLLRPEPRARRLMARKALHDDPVDLGWRMRPEDRVVQITGEVAARVSFTCCCQRANSSSWLGDTRVCGDAAHTAEGGTADTWGGVAIICSPHCAHVMLLDFGRLRGLRSTAFPISS